MCNDKGVDEVRRLVALIEHVAETPVCDTQVLRTEAGEAVLFHEGLPVISKTYVDGAVYPRLDENQLRCLGRTLAMLHAVPPPAGLATGFGLGVDSFEEVVGWPGSGEFGAWLARLRDHLEPCLDPDLPRGLIHGDLFADNVVWRGSEPTMIDFEEAADYFLVFDIGMGIVGACFSGGTVSLGRARRTRASGGLGSSNLTRPRTSLRPSMPRPTTNPASSTAMPAASRASSHPCAPTRSAAPSRRTRRVRMAGWNGPLRPSLLKPKRRI